MKGMTNPKQKENPYPKRIDQLLKLSQGNSPRMATSMKQHRLMFAVREQQFESAFTRKSKKVFGLTTACLL